MTTRFRHRLVHPPEWPVYTERAQRETARLVGRGRTFDYGHGPEISRLEETMARLTGRPHCLAVNSGTSALYSAYFALGIGPGDEVLVPTLTFPTTVTPLLLLGAVPVLCDAGDAHGNVTADTLRPHLTPRTRAIGVTHLWGHPVDMDPVVELARANGLLLIEDCSHAHGSTYRGRPVGGFGDAAVFSLGGVKTVSGGMGGVLVTPHRRVHEMASLLTAFRQRSRATVEDPALTPYIGTGLGANLRMSPLACVLAQSHLDDLDRLLRAKAGNFRRLESLLADCPDLVPLTTDPGCDPGARYGLHLAVTGALEGRRDEVVAALRATGLKVRPPTTAPLHRDPLFASGPPGGWALHPGVRPGRPVRPTGPHPRADALWDSWIALPATHLYEENSTLVDAYAERITAVVADLRERAPATPTRSGR
ncbi:DegT/DnrJ/EryC1/StrS family aminotransferase [Streptomyces sp. NPDC057682]|uniref:DegT/DnrJ/EryC1/StrS family aminotransferase n=1 Tax=Streptomyces sp. NPDC057682 TaxID=3346210 RepID=UPI0036A85328